MTRDNSVNLLAAPLRFVPRYQVLVWGGRRLREVREDVPDGPVGESWELADHERGMSVVAEGPLAGTDLGTLTRSYPEALVGAGFTGRTFPLMVKLIDAADRLSVQVHPDDALAQAMGVGSNGKTECWYLLADGGCLYQGTRPDVDRTVFERALAAGQLEPLLNRFDVRAGDFFFLAARTVHALGAGCLLFEVQQTSDVTFRVDDWGRLGLDGKPRPLHVEESLRTIDFAPRPFGPSTAPRLDDPRGGQTRSLVDGDFFAVDEWRWGPGQVGTGGRAERPRANVLMVAAGDGVVRTAGGTVALTPWSTTLIPAHAGPWTVEAGPDGLTLLVAAPNLGG